MALAILGQGLSSRLNQSVREKQRLVQDISSGMFNGQSPGLIYLWADLEAEQAEAALGAAWAEVERMKAEAVSAEELQRQMVKIEHEEAGECMSMEGMAGKLGYYECLGDYRLSDSLTKKMRAVGVQDIQRVMKRYFNLDRSSLVIYRSKKSKALNLSSKQWAASIAKAGESGAAAPQASAKAGASGLFRTEFSNGLSLIIKPIRHTPLVAMQAILPGGAKADPQGKAGAANLLMRLLLKGAPGMDAPQIASRLDDLGASLSPYADSDRFAMAGQMLSSKFEDTLELAGMLLRHATLPEAELEKERERVLKSIKDKSDQADDYVADVFSGLFFKGTPYALPVEGTKKSVESVERKDLLQMQASCLSPKGMLLVLTGDLDPAKAVASVEKVFGPSRWKAPKGGAWKPRAVAPLKPKAGRAQEKLNKKQAHVMLGWPAPSPTDPDYYACRLLNSIFGEGMDSRLFTEVRDKRALCYTVQAFMDRRTDFGAWRVYVGTQPENEKQAIQVVLDVAKELVEKGVSEAELKAAKAYSKGIFQVARQDFSTEARILANYEAWGLGAEEVDRMAGKVDAVTLEEVRAAAKKHFLIDKTAVGVVRP
jgi:zinc protease